MLDFFKTRNGHIEKILNSKPLNNEKPRDREIRLLFGGVIYSGVNTYKYIGVEDRKSVR